MPIIRQRITIIKIRKPAIHDLNEDIQFLGNSLGLFNLRDKDQSCFRLFVELLKTARQHKSISSDDLAFKLRLTRGTVIHHINKLIESGIVISERNRYFLRVDKLENLVDELQKDLLRTCDDLKEIAKEIDVKLGL